MHFAIKHRAIPIKSFVTPLLFSTNAIQMKVELSPIALRYNGEVRSTTGYSNTYKIDIDFYRWVINTDDLKPSHVS